MSTALKHNPEGDELSEKPRLGENFAWWVFRLKTAAANDCCIREKREVKLRLVSGERFPGQYYDQETGLYYNLHRYYNPATGRYITSDPIGLDGGLNTYTYALNNPIRFIDPKGLTSIIGCATPAGAATCIEAGIIAGSRATPIVIPKPKEKCEDDACPPCKTVSGKIVAVGTIAYRPLDTPPPGKIEHGIDGPHYNIYEANQIPKGNPIGECDCFWKPLGAIWPSELSDNAMPIEPFDNSR